MNDYVGVPITTMEKMLPNTMFIIYGQFLVWVWLGLLNCVIEGWFRLKLHDKEIDGLVGSDISNATQFSKDLKNFRNAVFHYRNGNNDLGTPIQQDFLHDDIAMKWAMDLNIEFEKWFDYYFTSNNLPRDEPGYEWFKERVKQSHRD